MSTEEIRNSINIIMLVESDTLSQIQNEQDIISKTRKIHPDITYIDDTDKVIAILKNHNSAEYTKLAGKLERIKKLEQEITAEENEVKELIKNNVAGLFGANDVTKSRIIDTVSFIIELSKNPNATVTYKYAKVLEELEKNLTTELIKVLEAIKEKFKTTTQKTPSLKISRKDAINQSMLAKHPIDENTFEKFKDYYEKFENMISKWAEGYDRKLNYLKRTVDL